MAKIKELTGQVFGNLTVLGNAGRKNGYVLWCCQCTCGNETNVTSINLLRGVTTSCGCKRKGVIRNIAGQRFGKLVAIEPTDKRSGNSVVWKCKCDCGNEAQVSSNHLTGGVTRSCGCEKKPKSSNEKGSVKLVSPSSSVSPGQRFGRLVALEPTDGRKNRSVIWHCKCDCGNEVFTTSNQLVTGHKKSCGCLQDETRRRDISGQRFGRLIALKPTDERAGTSIVWQCKCDCGNEVFVSSHLLVGGDKKSCGCLRKESQRRDIKGQRFGSLVALEPTDKRYGSSIVWRCKCDCGNEVLVSVQNLIKRKTSSCTCNRRQNHAPSSTNEMIEED